MPWDADLAALELVSAEIGLPGEVDTAPRDRAELAFVNAVTLHILASCFTLGFLQSLSFRVELRRSCRSGLFYKSTLDSFGFREEFCGLPVDAKKFRVYD